MTTAQKDLPPAAEEGALLTYIATQESPEERTGYFATPKDYSEKLAFKTNLKELYDIIGIQVTNAWQSHNQPYVIVVEIKEDALKEIYKGSYLVQIWKKASETSGTMLYERAWEKTPKDFTIRKDLCVYLTQDDVEGSDQVNHQIHIINLEKQTEFAFDNPFKNSTDTCVYVDVEHLILACGKKVLVYDTQHVLHANKLEGQKEQSLKCDHIVDVNFTAMGKSYIMISAIVEEGRSVNYFTLALEQTSKEQKEFSSKNLKIDLFSEFKCEISDEKYVKCAIQPYDYYVLLTDKGNFEIYKSEGPAKYKLQFSSHKFFSHDAQASVTKKDKLRENKIKLIQEIMDSTVQEVRVVYNYLFIKTTSQKKTYFVQIAKLQEFYPEIQKEEFDETILQRGLFNPVFFNNHVLNEEDIMLTHERFVSIKNIPTGYWQHIELFPPHSNFRDKSIITQELQLYKISNNNTLVASLRDNISWLIKKDSPDPQGEWAKQEIKLGLDSDDTTKVQAVYQLQSNPAVLFLDMKSEILTQRKIMKLEIKKKNPKPVPWINTLVADINIKLKFIPIRTVGAATLFILYNLETKIAGLHQEEIKAKDGVEFKDLQPAIQKFTAVDTISACTFKKDTILILNNGQFYEYNIPETRLITHTKPYRGAIDKNPIDSDDLYIFNERFLYFIDTDDDMIYIADLWQFKQGGISIKDFVKIEVSSTYHHCLSIDHENERIILMKSRFEAWIFPFLHLPRIIIYKSLSNPDNFVLSEQVADKLYAFDRLGGISVWSTITSHLLSYEPQADFKWDDWEYLCQAERYAVMMKKEIVEEGKVPAKHDEVDHTYQVVGFDFVNGECKIKVYLSYIHRHKKFVNLRFGGSPMFSRMIQQNGKSDIASVFELEKNKWKLVRELLDIKDFGQISPCMTYFYSPSTFKFLDVEAPKAKGKQIAIIDQEDQIERFKLPDAISKNVSEVIIKPDNKIVIILKNYVCKEYELIGKNLNEIRRFVHHFDDLAVCRQYYQKELIFLQSKDDPVQTLARLNDFYRFQIKYNKVHVTNAIKDDTKYKAVFSISDSFVDNKSAVNFPFTFYHWSLMEKIATQDVKLQLIQKPILQELLFVINPQGHSLFYKMANQFKNLKYTYDTINDQFEGIVKLPKCLDMLPFVAALDGKNPLQIASDKRDAKSCDQFLLVLKNSEFDNHQHEMQEFYEKAFEFNLGNIVTYFDNRLFDSAELGLKVDRGGLEMNEDGFNLTTTALGENDQAKVKSETCTTENLDVPILMKVLDIPGVHRFDNEWSKTLLKCLSETERTEIFQNISLRAILDYKWPSIKNALIIKLFIPYVLFLLTFIYFTVFMVDYFAMVNNIKDFTDLMEKKGITDRVQACSKGFFSDKDYIFQQAHLFNVSADQMDDYCQATEPKFKPMMNEWRMYLEIAVLVFVFYFFWNEARQMKDGMKEYLMNVWNYVDLMPLALITIILLSNLIIGTSKAQQNYMRSIISMAVFFMWVKFLYFLRLFKGTSYLISMIIQVVSDMKTFLGLFLLSTLAFGNCFYVFNENLGGDTFINNYFKSFTYVYEVNLGKFDNEVFGKGSTTDHIALYVLFFMSTVFLMITMLTLLIAIIGDTYNNVNAQATNLMYKGMADLIYENDYLLSSLQLNAFHKKAGEYLVIVGTEENLLAAQDVDAIIAQVQNQLQTNHTKLFAYVRNMKKDWDEQDDKEIGFMTRAEQGLDSAVKWVADILKTLKNSGL